MENNFIPEDPMPITASFGVATSGADRAFEEAFRQADEALYQAKDRGRNCVVVANRERSERAGIVHADAFAQGRGRLELL